MNNIEGGFERYPKQISESVLIPAEADFVGVAQTMIDLPESTRKSLQNEIFRLEQLRRMPQFSGSKELEEALVLLIDKVSTMK